MFTLMTTVVVVKGASRPLRARRVIVEHAFPVIDNATAKFVLQLAHAVPLTKFDMLNAAEELMRTSLKISFTNLAWQQVVAILCVILVQSPAIAQSQKPEAPPPAAMTPAQLDQLMAPVALYPDPLLAQVLAASTFPTDIVQADRWAKQHKNLQGQQLTDAVVQANLPYDPSIISLIQFPTVLDMMSQKLDWTSSLGNAVLTQRSDVMAAVQRMRRKAEQAGNLKTSQQVQVVSSPTVIEIQPANPQVIYVPVYNPQVIYVPAPPPPPGPSTGTVVAASLIAFGVGVAVGAAASHNSCCWYGGSIGWHTNTVVIANNSFNRTWVTRGYMPPPPPYYRPGGPYPPGRPPLPPPGRPMPYGSYGNANVNVNRNVNVNVNNTTVNNVNRNTVNNVNQNTVNNVNRNTANSVNQNTANNMNRTTASAGAAQTANRGYTQPAAASRPTAYSGAKNGSAEKAASQRGQAARGSRQR
jgi:hypothetical protein